MDVNDNAGSLTPRCALRFIASRLAPTGVAFAGSDRIITSTSGTPLVLSIPSMFAITSIKFC
ncbi:hypothetical protein DKY63_00285 [Pseudomonas putida]|uniref:Uncharacterized protein n=1 Tax=Pseudomonas putida TaxID=303 RepID=A0A2Z4RBE9_PSEPU|nr:hypothetical protein DKY63_00285 [Pseudomonas putida]